MHELLATYIVFTDIIIRTGSFVISFGTTRTPSRRPRCRYFYCCRRRLSSGEYTYGARHRRLMIGPRSGDKVS